MVRLILGCYHDITRGNLIPTVRSVAGIPSCTLILTLGCKTLLVAVQLWQKTWQYQKSPTSLFKVTQYDFWIGGHQQLTPPTKVTHWNFKKGYGFRNLEDETDFIASLDIVCWRELRKCFWICMRNLRKSRGSVMVVHGRSIIHFLMPGPMQTSRQGRYQEPRRWGWSQEGPAFHRDWLPFLSLEWLPWWNIFHQKVGCIRILTWEVDWKISYVWFEQIWNISVCEFPSSLPAICWSTWVTLKVFNQYENPMGTYFEALKFM